MKVTVDNFQSLGHVEIDIEGLTALVGPSDRGKSALTRALEGAFFNIPGEYFIRTGTERATVKVAWGEHSVVWRKGGGKNEFEIDGVLHAKVGAKAPDALKRLGFRDELIGARIHDDGSTEGGKWVRPQFAGQFDEIYLLTEQGTFISEVIVKLSRLGVLQRAERQCALDLRSAKSTLKTRQGDLEVATAAVEKLAPALLLRARLDGLLTLWDDLEDQQGKAVKIRQLVTRRQTVLARQQLALPAIDANRTTQAAEMVEDYQQLLRARQSVLKRARLASLPKKLPKTRATPDTPEYKALAAVVTRWKELSQLIGARQMRLTRVDSAESVLRAAETKVTAAAKALEQFKASMPVCPFCAQPWQQQRVEEVMSV